MIAAVTCVDKNWGIGYNNELLVHIPEDLKYFKEITKDGTVIVGSKTYESLPNRPLPERCNIVITSKCKKRPKMWRDGSIHSNMKYIKEWLQNKEVIEENKGLYIIGGGFIYKELLNLCERVYITKVYEEYTADTYFPNIDEMPEWEMTSVSEIKEYNGIKYQFCVYDRVDYKIVGITQKENKDSLNGFDLIIRVDTFNSKKEILLSMLKGNKVEVYSDGWDYLGNKDNLEKFVDKATEFNKSRFKEDE